MANLKWDIHNWITVVLMVAIAYAAAGLVKSMLAGSPLGTAS